MPPRSRPTLVLLLAAAASATAGCKTDDDCNQLGTCSANGSCACAPGFAGAACGELDFAPAAPLDAGGMLWPKFPASDAGVASSWGFTSAFDRADGLWHAVVTVACGGDGVVGSGGGESWLAHLTSEEEDGPYSYVGMMAPQTTFGPHLTVARDGTIVLYFRVNELLNATLCAGDGRDPQQNASTIAGSLVPPSALVSGDPEKGTSIYVAWADSFRGPWGVQKIVINNGDAGGDVIHKSNPAVVELLQPVGSASWAMAYRLNFHGELNAIALADDFRGPWRCITNITGEPGEDPVFFQLPGQDSIGHILLHNGPFGYHAFGRLDGSPWRYNVSSHAFTLNVSISDGSELILNRRERPELRFFANGTARALYASAQGPPPGRCFSLVQPLRT